MFCSDSFLTLCLSFHYILLCYILWTIYILCYIFIPLYILCYILFCCLKFCWLPFTFLTSLKPLQIRPANFLWNQSGFYVLFLQSFRLSLYYWLRQITKLLLSNPGEPGRVGSLGNCNRGTSLPSYLSVFKNFLRYAWQVLE